MIAADLGRAAILASVPVAAFMERLTIEHLYVVVLLAGTLTVFFEVADQSFLPAVVEREHIVEGNSKLGASGSVAEIGAPAIAGTLVQLVTAPVAILVDAVSFLFSALFIGWIRTPEPPAVPHEERHSAWRDAVEGLRVVLGNPLLRALAGAASTDVFFGGFYTMYGLFAIRELGLTPIVLELLVGSGGLGSLVGALLSGRAVRRFGLGKTLLGGAALTGGLQVFTPLAGGPVAVAAGMMFISQVFGDMVRTIYTINEVSLRQAITPDRMLGRTNATMHFMVGGAGLLGALVGGALGQAIGPRLTLLLAVTGGSVLGFLWLYFSPVRRLGHENEG
jgi:predicted MFS family arabinose efflux permease